MTSKKSIVFEKIKDELVDILSPGFIEMMFEACIVALDSKQHKSKTLLQEHENPDNLYRPEYEIIWEKEIDDKLTRSHRDKDRTTDYGAMFLTLTLFCTIEEIKQQLKEDFVFETAAKGTGIDFWICRKSTKLEFIARIEVSGIREENSTNTVEYRLKVKQNQTKQSDGTTLPVFISIIEFSSPKSLIINKVL